MSINWELYRQPDGAIDIKKAWYEHNDEIVHNIPAQTAERFLDLAVSYRPIYSRQVAALALMLADYIYMTEGGS